MADYNILNNIRIFFQLRIINKFPLILNYSIDSKTHCGSGGRGGGRNQFLGRSDRGAHRPQERALIYLILLRFRNVIGLRRLDECTDEGSGCEGNEKKIVTTVVIQFQIFFFVFKSKSIDKKYRRIARRCRRKFFVNFHTNRKFICICT